MVKSSFPACSLLNLECWNLILQQKRGIKFVPMVFNRIFVESQHEVARPVVGVPPFTLGTLLVGLRVLSIKTREAIEPLVPVHLELDLGGVSRPVNLLYGYERFSVHFALVKRSNCKYPSMHHRMRHTI